MSPITVLLLATLAILSPILSSPIQPRKWGHEIDYGVLTSDYVPGFIGDRPYTGPDGDYVRATFCYCASPLASTSTSASSLLQPRQRISYGNGDGQHGGEDGGLQPGELVAGHYWRYEYYNYHYNATYFLNHYCLEDVFPLDNYGCGYDGPGGFEPAPDSFWHMSPQNDWSFTYSPLPGHERHSWIVMKKQTDVDWIFFGRGEPAKQQKRRLGKDQGLIEMPESYVVEKCEAYCQSELLLPMNKQVKSHGELYNDIDDMCDRCA